MRSGVMDRPESLARRRGRDLRKRRRLALGARVAVPDERVSDSESSAASSHEEIEDIPQHCGADVPGAIGDSETDERDDNSENKEGSQDSRDGNDSSDEAEELGNDLDVNNGGDAMSLHSSDDSNHAEDEHEEADSDDDELQGDSQSESEEEPDVESDVESEVGSEDGSEPLQASDEEDSDEDEGDHPIYPGAHLTLHESLVAIFTLISSANLSGQLAASILSLISLHCPPDSIVKKTLYKFKKYFAKIGSALLVFHYFCSGCMCPVATKQSVCGRCKKTGDNISFFLEVPLVHQLQCLFRRENFYEDLQFRFKPNRKRNPENIEDIFDGNIYQDEMNTGFLRNPSNLSFMWYSDGVKVFNSASFSIWPLCLVINELAFKKRTLPENMVLCGLWFGKHKPSPNIFLQPLRATMKKLEADGHTFKLSDNSEVLVKAKVICGTCDMPAKCKFIQFKQFNGEYGCPRCLQPGGRIAVGARSSVQVYPFTANIPDRTHEQTKVHAREALEARRTDKEASVCGVKGPSILSKIVPDIIRCTAIDVMHGVYLGLCKMLINLWFNPTFSNQPWSVHHLENIVDEKLHKIKPPNHAVRAPRTLKDVKYWKASEFKLFFLYYSIPVLKGVMEECYLKHHCKVVSAVSLLSQDSISLDQVTSASNLLTSYVAEFATLYSLRYLGINVHQLLHLPGVVLDLGPLFVYSNFFLENFNGTINKFFHGTQHVAFQICSAASMYLQVPNIMKTLPQDSKALRFCALLESDKPCKVADVIDEVTIAVGKYNRNPQQTLHSRRIIQPVIGFVLNGQFDVFYRLKMNGVMYVSKEYPRVSKRYDSSFVSFHHDGVFKVGQIVRFLKYSDCGNICHIGCRNCPSTFYAIIEVYHRMFWFVHEFRDIRLPHMWAIEKSENVVAVTVQSLHNICFFLSANNECYLACPINRLEIE